MMLYRLMISATLRLTGSLIIGAIAGLLIGVETEAAHGILLGIAITASVFVISGAAVLWPMDAETTRKQSQRETLGPRLDELSVISTGLLGICVTVAILILGGSDAGYAPALTALLSIFMLWAGMHLMYAAHYAYLYYDQDQQRGITLGISTAPSYREFIYFSYSIGISSGIPGGMALTDTTLTTVVFRHSLLSYIFRTVIMAAAINVVVGVFTS